MLENHHSKGNREAKRCMWVAPVPLHRDLHPSMSRFTAVTDLGTSRLFFTITAFLRVDGPHGYDRPKRSKLCSTGVLPQVSGRAEFRALYVSENISDVLSSRKRIT